MGNVTIKDVAKAAQVSVATVSRALNGHGNVAAGVRERVQAAADALRYTPHAAARSLSSRRTHTLGVVLPDLYGEFFSELVRGIDQAARERGFHLLVSSYHGHPEEQGAAMRAMRGRVDGVLLMSPSLTATPACRDELAGTPAVVVNTRDAGDGVAALCVDNHGGAMAMVEHLAACGHRRIAFIAGPDDNFDAHERLRGYRDALARHVPDSEPWVLPGDFSEAGGHHAGQQLLASRERPDAVFAANDMMALGCMFAFQRAGLRIPDDIGLAGFNDIPLAAHASPPLTSMRIDLSRLGSDAFSLLLDHMEGDGGPVARIVQPELMVRAWHLEGDPHRHFDRVAAVERAFEHFALVAAAQQQQAGVRGRKPGRGQADASWPGAGPRATAGIHGDVGAGAVERLAQAAHAREERGDMAVAAHAQHDDARRLGGMQVGIRNGGFDAAPGSGQRFEARGGRIALQQVLVHQVGVAVGVLRHQPAFVDQGDVDPIPAQRCLRQRPEYRRRGAAAGHQQPRTRTFLQVAAQGGGNRDRGRPGPLVVVAELMQGDRRRWRRRARAHVGAAVHGRSPATMAAPSKPGCGCSTANTGTGAIASA